MRLKTMEVEMIKNKLQMFADEPAMEGKTKTEDPKTEDPKTDDGSKKPDDKKYTDEDVNRIIGEKFAKWEREQEKKISEAQKLAEMNAQERAEHERDELQRQLNEYKEKETLSQMRKEARKMLADEDIVLADNLLNVLVTPDSATTKEAVTSFVELFKKSVDEAVKDALKGNAPKTGGTQTSITKEEILAIKDRAERQKMIAEHQDLFR